MAAGWWPFLFVAVAGYLATDIWRWVGVVTATRLDETSEILRWVRAVSTALVAGLVARIVLFPIGAMAVAPFGARLGAVAVGAIAFYLLRQNVFLGILAGEAVLVGVTLFTLRGF